MAIRNIRMYGDPILRKTSRPVKDINSSIKILLDDMLETLESKKGLGIAAPQVGVLKRVIIAMDNQDRPVEIINPKVIESSGSQKSNEGCLSVKDTHGLVNRPEFIKVSGLNRNGEEILVNGNERLATVLSHEIDHLEGVLFIDKMLPDEKDTTKEE